MTNDNHPITPPDELVAQIRSDAALRGSGAVDELDYVLRLIHVAYRAGADRQLEACFEHLKRLMTPRATIDYLRSAMRPESPSLSESALDLIDKIEYNAMTKNAGNEKAWDLKELKVVRRALERLQELERKQ